MRYIIRRGGSQEWERINPVLGNLEPGWDYVEDSIRLGDGQTRWLDLPPYRRVGLKPVRKKSWYDRDPNLVYKIATVFGLAVAIPGYWVLFFR